MHIPAFICDAVRTPFGQQGGVLSSMPVAELGAIPLMALMVRNPQIDWEQLSDVLYGCTHPHAASRQSLARASSLLAGLPASVPGLIVNRLAGSGLEAVGHAARSIKSGESAMMIAGGLESASQLPNEPINPATAAAFMQEKAVAEGSIMNKEAAQALSYISTLETIEKLVGELDIERRSQDRFAYASHRKAYAAQQNGNFLNEITPVTHAQKEGNPIIVTEDEIARRVSQTELSGMEPLLANGTITPGNSANAGDGACALLIACEKAAYKYSLMPKARILGMAVAGVPDKSGIAASIAVRKLLVQTGLSIEEVAIIELHEAFAAQSIAFMRDWGMQDDDPRINPNGGTIAFGDPAGATGARLITMAVYHLHRIKERYALCVMSVEAGQGIALMLERV